MHQVELVFNHNAKFDSRFIYCRFATMKSKTKEQYYEASSPSCKSGRIRPHGNFGPNSV